MWDGCVIDLCYAFGLSTDTPVVGDWNGDGKKEIGVRRGNAWYLDYNSNGIWDGCAIDRCYTFGLATDIPVIGNWNNGGSDKIGVFRNGNWYLDYNGNGTWDSCMTDICIAFGLPTDIPVVGDWNGDGYTKIGVVRNGVWYLDYDGSDSWSGCAVDRCYSFGLPTDKPVVGDWNGDGYTKIGVRRGNAWYLDYNGNGSWSSCSTDKCYTFGLASDKPLNGNWGIGKWATQVASATKLNTLLSGIVNTYGVSNVGINMNEKKYSLVDPKSFGISFSGSGWTHFEVRDRRQGTIINIYYPKVYKINANADELYWWNMTGAGDFAKDITFSQTEHDNGVRFLVELSEKGLGSTSIDLTVLWLFR